MGRREPAYKYEWQRSRRHIGRIRAVIRRGSQRTAGTQAHTAATHRCGQLAGGMGGVPGRLRAAMRSGWHGQLRPHRAAQLPPHVWRRSAGVRRMRKGATEVPAAAPAAARRHTSRALGSRDRRWPGRHPQTAGVKWRRAVKRPKMEGLRLRYAAAGRVTEGDAEQMGRGAEPCCGPASPTTRSGSADTGGPARRPRATPAAHRGQTAAPPAALAGDVPDAARRTARPPPAPPAAPAARRRRRRR